LFAAFRGSVDTYRDYLMTDEAWRPQQSTKPRVVLLGTTVQLEDTLIEVLKDDPIVVAERAVQFEKLVGFATARVPADEARKHHERALTKLNELTEKYPDRPVYRRLLAAEQARFGAFCEEQKQPEGAEQAYREALRLRQALAGEQPADPDLAVDLARSHGELGDLLAIKNPAAALPEYDRAVNLLDEVLRGHEHALGRMALSIVLGNRAEALGRLGRFGDSLPDWDRSLELSDPPRRDGLQLARADARARAGNHAGALADLDDLAGRLTLSGQALYVSARICAVASAAVRRDGRLSASEQQHRADLLARRALTLLAAARDAGWFHKGGTWRN